MCASGVLENVEAALSMSHAITTHAIEAEIDWFAAMDDLKEEADDAGAGFCGTQEFGAGVFYQYASADVDLLAKHLGSDRKNALDVIARYLRVMATTTPTGKQHSFASHSLAHCVMVSVSDMPLSLANAFENPVKKGREGYVLPSVNAMLDYWEKVHKAYEIEEDVAIFSIDDLNIKNKNENVKAFATLTALQEWIAKED
jgi:CRISPR system Cascade subunit CasC